MNGTPAPAPVVTPASSAEIDASCRAPVLVLFAGAALWLLVASVFGLIASLKIHAPNLLADSFWFTYGHVQAMQINALIYGFAAQAGLGVTLWLVARMGRTALAQPGYVVVGALLWNFGVKLGLFGIQIGDSTGYDWLEMPGYASPVLFVAYAIMGVCALLTFGQRREPALYVSQWFLLAALFWFPWIYSSAQLLLVFFPVRGVFQAVVDGWYVGNLNWIWFGFIGLATIFYFLPKLTGRPLYSNYLVMLAFWTLALFGGWGGGNIHHGAPMPAWIPSLSTVFTVLNVVPLLALAINFGKTIAGAPAAINENLPLRFVMFGALAYVVAGTLNVLAAFPKFSRVAHFTWFEPARTQLFLYGFLGMTLFGAMYYIVPRLIPNGWPSMRLARAHFRFAIWGLPLYFAALAAGGSMQARALTDPNIPFVGALGGALMFFRVSTLGEVLMAVGNGALALNVGWLLVRYCRECCVPSTSVAAGPELAEATR